jgi:hypothetical protein
MVRVSEIELRSITDVAGELHVNRPIQPETLLDVPHEFGARIPARHLDGYRTQPALLPARRAPGQYEEDREDDGGDEAQHDSRPEQAPDDVLEHRFRLSAVPLAIL